MVHYRDSKCFLHNEIFVWFSTIIPYDKSMMDIFVEIVFTSFLQLPIFAKRFSNRFLTGYASDDILSVAFYSKYRGTFKFQSDIYDRALLRK